MKRSGAVTALLFAVLIAAPVRAQDAPGLTIRFEGSALEHMLEVYGLAAGSLRFSYDVPESGVVRYAREGRPPLLREADAFILLRLVMAASEDATRVTEDEAYWFKQRYYYGRAAFQDSQIYRIDGTARRFNLSDEQAWRWVEAYVSLTTFLAGRGTFKPFPVLPEPMRQ